nr:Thy1 protein [Danio rerio]
MLCYTAFATLFLLGVVTAQTSLRITSCLTKDQNLQMSCTFTPAPDTKLSKTCYYMTDNKLIGSTNSSSTPDSTFRNRANVTITDNKCDLYLKGLPDSKPANYTCFIRQTAAPVSIIQTVDKSKLQTCSAWSVLQHSGVAFLLALLTFPLLSELL